MGFSGVGDRHLIGVGVAGVNGGDLDFDVDPGFLNHPWGIRQPFIGGIPSQETTKQPHIGSLTFVGGCQRAIRIEFDEHILDFPIHQIPDHSADPNGGGTMRTGWATHGGTNHIVEYAGVGLG